MILRTLVLCTLAVVSLILGNILNSQAMSYLSPGFILLALFWFGWDATGSSSHKDKNTSEAENE